MTILNSVDITREFNVIFFIIMLVACIAGILLFIFSICDCPEANLIPLSLVAALLFGFCAYKEATADKGYQYTKIECMIDDLVPAAEIIDKYEVIEKRGDIYVLKYIDESKKENK